MKSKILGLLALGLLAGPMAASAVQVSIASYDTSNGHGQASGGTFNYWDRSYNGTGNTTQDDAPLTGGVGDLTDGSAATDFWYNVENGAGTGPYVGWYSPVRPNPLVQFNFTMPWTVDEIRVHVDNSTVGGVYQPIAYFVNGNPWSFTALANGTLGWITLTGAPVTGSSLSLTFVHRSVSDWIFASEVEIFGVRGSSVPEPGTLALLGLGLAGLGLSRRRKA
jgi:hypothetical protein